MSQKISRREFFISGGALTASLAAAPILDPSPVLAAGGDPACTAPLFLERMVGDFGMDMQLMAEGENFAARTVTCWPELPGNDALLEQIMNNRQGSSKGCRKERRI